jgi:tetratricopeptide (TPR) repeat protein
MAQVVGPESSGKPTHICAQDIYSGIIDQVKSLESELDSHVHLYAQTNNVKCLGDAIDSAEKALRVLATMPAKDLCICIAAIKGMIKYKLSCGLHARADIVAPGEVSIDLQRSIALTDEVLQKKELFESRPVRFDRLRLATMHGQKLLHLFKRTGELSTLNSVVGLLEQAVEHDPRPHQLLELPEGAVITPQPGASLQPLHDAVVPIQLLAVSLCERNYLTRSFHDLDRSLSLSEKLVRTAPTTPTRNSILVLLSVCLIRRYETKGSTENNHTDLRDAAILFGKMIEGQFVDNGESSDALHRCAYFLFAKHQKGHLPELQDLAMAMVSHVNKQKHNELRSEDYPDKAEFVFRCAIAVRDAIMKATPQEHMYRAEVLSIYLDWMIPAYDKWGGDEHGNLAVENARSCLEDLPSDSPERARLLTLLGQFLMVRCREIPGKKEEALRCWSEALEYANGSLKHRLRSGRYLLEEYANIKDWPRAYEVAETTIRLVPKLAPRSLWQYSDRRHRVKIDGYQVLQGLASDAAAVALRAGKGPVKALEFLEIGRGVVASSLQDAQTDIIELQRLHPGLAMNFDRLRTEINSPDTSVTQRHTANTEFDRLLDEIHGISGFEHFLSFPGEDAIKNTAQDGPIVVINVSYIGCDAIIARHEKLEALKLPELSKDDIESQHLNADTPPQGLKDILEGLWDVVADPILITLGFTERIVQPERDWPHIWWIPTGVLTRMPIHAAGYHDRGTGETVLDRVMSSYSLSIKALIQARNVARNHQPLESMHNGCQREVLLVAMAETEDHTYLYSALKETMLVRDICQSIGFRPVQPTPNTQEILEHLATCDIFHFAGHGETNPLEPSMSRLLLKDWKSNSLTVASIQGINLWKRSSPPFLAYLSACGTGNMISNRTSRIPTDENVHLVSACQIAGFRHVVGTLWAVDDVCCKDIAQDTYQTLKDEMSTNKEAITNKSVCFALHQALRKARDEWQNGGRQRSQLGNADANDGVPENENSKAHNAFARGEIIKGKRAYWMPYVHYGI